MIKIRKPGEEIGNLPGDTTVEGRELTVAKKLVESLTVDWSPGEYHNTYRTRVEELIESKRAGGTVTPSAERPRTNVADLMTALEESIARARGQAAPAGRKSVAHPAAAPKRGRRKTSLTAGRASRDLSSPGDMAEGEEAPDARASSGYRGLLRLRAGPGALPRHCPRAPGRLHRVHR